MVAAAAGEAPLYTSAELITIMGVFFGGLAGIIAAVFAGFAAIRAVKTQAVLAETKAAVVETKAVALQVHTEVKTMNGLRMGELADAAETRRVDAIPPGERTDAEAAHVLAVPDRSTVTP